MNTFREIPLANLKPNPKNPRRHCDDKKLAELAASIKQKGVIEPIIVRPSTAPLKGGELQYEIVAGERRFKASKLAGLATIPAIIRELTDDEAYDFMLIENLQRDDLTDREEAESFKAYIGKHGEEAIASLAEKTGITQAYIRSRVRILALPAKVLKAWEKGDLAFGHLQQLLRLMGEKELKEMIDWTIERLDDTWEGPLTVKELAAHIDEQAPALSAAFFPTKPCAECPSSSTVQRDLFGVESKGARCLNPACFKKLQNEYLNGHWKETALAKKCGTNGFRFSEWHNYGDFHHFGYGDNPGAKCKACPNFVTVIELTGKVDYGQACAGERSCWEAVTRPRNEKEKATGERDPEAPRAAWHGEYFRDVFLTKRIPEILGKIDPAGPVARALLLACAIHGHNSELSIQESYAGAILRKKPAEADAEIVKTIQKIILSGQHVGPSKWNGFGTKGRRLVADFLGIDLAKEFAVDQDYLGKKTKAEILAFGKKFKLFGKPPAEAEALAKKMHLKPRVVLGDPAKLKKAELVSLVLAHGKDLVGKVPAEILK